MTYRIVAEDLVETALDLQEEAMGIAQAHARDWYMTGGHITEARRMASLQEAAGLIARAAELLLALDPSPELAAEVRALEALCLCGHDRGEHLCAAPHVCEGRGCLCTRFESETLAPSDLFATEPPTEAAITTPPEVA